MTIPSRPSGAAVASGHEETANGAALAALLGAGIGAFAVGFFVVINEAGLFVAPSLYAPAGGVSGRTTFAAATWLIAWGLLHSRWKGSHVESRFVGAATMTLTGLGILGTCPLVWGLF